MSKSNPTIRFIRLERDNFECLFPRVPLVPGEIETEAMEYGMLYVEGRGWDPCAIDGDVPFAVFFQDARKKEWNRIRFKGDAAIEMSV